MTVTWSREAIEALGPTTDVPTSAAILDVNPWSIYESIRQGEWTLTRVLRIRRSIKIPTHDLIKVLYETEAPAAPAPHAIPAVPSPCQHAEYSQVTASTPHTSCGCTPADSAVTRPLRGA